MRRGSMFLLFSMVFGASALCCREPQAGPRPGTPREQKVRQGAAVARRSPSTPLKPTVQRGDDVGRALAELRQPTPNASTPAPMSQGTLASIQRVYTDPGDIPQLQVTVDGQEHPLPLEHTHVAAELTGHVARVEVSQTYKNPFAYPIEAIYVFPLPENSAVDDMRIVIGERTIVAEIKKREQARQIYQDAKRQGHTAALLEQERPNIFTQSVANIEPGSNIDVVIRYLQTLTYDAGEYELVFPMVVGPRFIPGTPTGTRSGSGWSQDSTDVPDASRITPPVIGAGQRSGHDISLEVAATAALPIATFEVPTHQVVETATVDGSLKLKLAESDSLPNRDFVLRYRVDGKEPKATVLAHKQQDGGFLSLIVHPPKLDLDELVGQRELIFVVDVSGSMNGVPLAMCQDAMQEAIRSMRPVDTFNVVTFAGRAGQAFASPRPANEHNIQQARELIQGLRAGGGTHMLEGVRAALSPPVAEGRHRYVLFLTDGYVGNEKQILAATEQFVSDLKRQGQRARVFGFGVGSSVNRHLLDGLATAGEGVTTYATTREDPTLAVKKLYRIIDHPVLSDIAIDWGDLQVEQVFPAQLPDLLATRPFVVHARYRAGGESEVHIRGKSQGRQVSIPVEVSLPREPNDSHGTVATLWARAKIGSLSRDLWTGHSPQAVEAITDLGLSFRIVTPFTSFVAVDRSKKVEGQARTIVQPVEVPEGVDPLTSGAHAASRAMAQQRFGLLSAPGAGYGSGARPHPAKGVAPGGRRSRRMHLRSPASGLAGSARLAPSAPPSAAMQERAADSDATASSLKARGQGSTNLSSPKQKTEAPRRDGRQQRAADGQLRVEGGLSVAAVRAVIEQHHTALERLLEQARRRGGLAGARVQLRWFVTAQGNAIQVRVQGLSSRDDALARALADLVRRWQFPKPRDGRSVRVTYVLTL